MMKATKWLDQRDIKRDTRDCFLFESWVVSKRSDEAAMDIVEDMIFMVKTKKVLC